MAGSQVSKPGTTVAEVHGALAALQSATRDVLGGIRGLHGSRPIDLVHAIGIDLKLAWKITHLAQSGEPFACVRHLPAAVSWRIWVEAAAAHGATSASIAKATEALEQAQRAGIAWAGDRRAFAALAANAATRPDHRFNAEHRRQLYEGGMHVWGMRARMAMRLDILAPSSDGQHLDCATIRGFVDLDRLRPDAPWRLEAPAVIDDDASVKSSKRTSPLEGSASDDGPPFLMRSLSSTPLPSLRRATSKPPYRALELAEGEVGLRGRSTIVQGAMLRRTQPLKVGAKSHGVFQVFRLRTPVESQVFDLLVHADLLGGDKQPEAIMYGDLYAAPALRVPYGPHDRLPCGIELTTHASAMRGLKLAGLPGYAAVVGAVLEREKWNPRNFRFFRARVTYPPVPSTLMLELPVPEG